MRFIKICDSRFRELIQNRAGAAFRTVSRLTLLFIIGALSQPANAQDYEYKFTISSGGDQLQGDIVTTTNNGALSIGDVVSYSFYDATAASTIQGTSVNIGGYPVDGGALDTGFYLTPSAILINDWVASSGPYLYVTFGNAQGGKFVQYAAEGGSYQQAIFDFYCYSGCATNGDHSLFVPGVVSIPDISSLSTEAPPSGSAAVQTLSVAAVPEPTVLDQLGIGLLLLGGVRKLRRARA